MLTSVNQVEKTRWNLGEYFSRGKNLRVTDVLSSSRGCGRELLFTKMHTLRKHFWYVNLLAYCKLTASLPSLPHSYRKLTGSIPTSYRKLRGFSVL
jgi:hypothetical protein